MTEIRIKIPTFHAGQVKIWNRRGRRNAVRCGRRFGKSLSIITIATDAIIKGKYVGIFTPEHRQWQELYHSIVELTNPVLANKNKNDAIIRSITGGKIDFWHLTDNELAARGREYDIILIDEAAFTKNSQMMDIWHKSIVPTMATRPNATVWVFSTPKGIDPDNFFYNICNDPGMDFVQHHAPSWENPLVSMEWVKDEKTRLPPDVYLQEIEAVEISWAGIAFFSRDKLLVDGQPVPYPTNCDSVFAVIDSAVKAGTENDGTAVLYAARNRYYGTPIIILDYDIIQIEADLLTTWVPNVVLPRLDQLSKECGAREGSRGVWVEDAASGSVIIQRGQRMGWPVWPVDSSWTCLGKDERAIGVSAYHHQGMAKISEYAYNKQVTFKGATRNHLLTQTENFRIGDKDAAKRADDALDTYINCLQLSLGEATFKVG